MAPSTFASLSLSSSRLASTSVRRLSIAASSSLSSASRIMSSNFACRVSLLPLALTFRMRRPLGIVPSAVWCLSILILAKRTERDFLLSWHSPTLFLRIDLIVESSLEWLPEGIGAGSSSSDRHRLSPALS